MAEQQSGATSLRRLLRAASHSFDGFRAALTEASFRLEVVFSLILIPAGMYFGRSGMERALLIGSVLLVLVVELLNSAIEAVVDRVSLENHVLSKRAKDIGSAAVAVSLANVVAVWLLILA